MRDDELKQYYQEQSNEQSPEALDKLIRQQAQDEVTRQKVTKLSNLWQWQPGLATAASLVVVFLLAFQFRALYWDVPSAIQPPPPNEAIIKRAPVQSAPATALAPQQKMESAESDFMTAREPEPKMMLERSRQLSEQKKAVQKQHLTIEAQANERQLSREEETGLARDIALLKQIQSLLEQGEKDSAKKLWQELQSRYPEEPKKEPLRSLWLGIKPAFE